MAIFNMGSIVNEPPVLNSSYPADITVREGATASATFKVEIATHGIPDEYTYQWYVDGVAVSGATGASYTKSDLTRVDTTDVLRVKTYGVYCIVTNDAGSVVSRTATLTFKSALPTLSSGNATITRQNSYDWLLTVTGGTTLVFSDLGNCSGSVNVFCVGGGGAGGWHQDTRYYGGGGGGGGKTTTATKTITTDTSYAITIGAGATAGSRGSGGTTSALGVSAAGGTAGSAWCAGGSGGSGGGAGGYSSGQAGGNGGRNGGNGTSTKPDSRAPGTGQGTTTGAFGNSNDTWYAGGGAGGTGISSGSPGKYGGNGTSYDGGGPAGGNGTANTGGGGGGAQAPSVGKGGGGGGSGIVLIRNAR